MNIEDLKYSLEMCRTVITQLGDVDNNYHCMVHWYWRLYYKLKACICILMAWETKQKSYEFDGITVAIFGGRSTFNLEFGSGAEWEYLSVGADTFGNWKYLHGSDGYP